MKCMIVVLAVASFCLAEPEADPAYLYAPYSYPYFYRPYAASGIAGPLPRASYQSFHRLHKREAEADPQILLNAAPFAPVAPVVNQGPVAGPLTAAFGDLVATERGLRPISLEGFSEDVNQDGFVDPVAQAVPAPVVAPLTVAAPAPVVRTVAAPAPVAPVVHAAPVVAPAAPVVQTVAAPAPVRTIVNAPFFASPVVRTVAAPAPIAPVVAPAAAPVALSSHDCVTPHGCAVKSALLTGARTGAFAHVTSTIVKREAEAEPEAEADADAFYGFYGYNAYPYAPYAAPYAPYAYNALPYAYNPYGYNYFGAYAGYPYAAPVAAPAPVAPVVEAAPAVAAPVAAPLVAAPAAPVVAAPAPVVKTVTKPVTYTHIGAHPVQPTTVLETETYI